MPGRSVPRSVMRRRLTITLMSADALAILFALSLAGLIRFGSVGARVAFESPELDVSFWELSILVIPLWIGLLVFTGLYDLDRVSRGISDAGRVTRALSVGVVAVIFITFFLRMPGLSRGWLLLAWALSVTAVVLTRATLGILVEYARRRGRMLQPTLVVGSNAESSDIIRVLSASRGSGLVPIGCLTSSLSERLELDYCSDDVPVVGSAREITQAIAQTGATCVIIASSAFDHDVLARMVAELRDIDVDVHVSSGLFEVLTSRVVVSEVAGVPLITIKGAPLSRTNLLVKRVFDLVVSLAIIAVGLPLWTLIAAIIKFQSPGSIFYTQTRVGRDGAQFEMVKFRSMYRDADARLAELEAQNEAQGPMFKMKDDPRVTPFGRTMRKFSIDEFPQLINVVRGEMSLVGPRPPLPHESEKYSRNDWRRLEVVPGMTGLWQVSGRSGLTFDEMVRLDIFYIENWSVALDVNLLFRTLPAVIFARGAY